MNEITQLWCNGESDPTDWGTKPLFYKDAEIVWQHCMNDPEPPSIFLVNDEVYHRYVAAFDKRRSRSHARKVHRERIARCKLGVHAWAPGMSICLACYISAQEFEDQQPEATP